MSRGPIHKAWNLRMIPRLRLVLWAPLLVFVMVGCHTSSEEASADKDSDEMILHYFTWTDYVDRHLLAEFRRRTGVKVIADSFASNEELLAKLQGGAAGYDVAVPSDYMVSIMAQEGLLADLDLSSIPNAQRLTEPFRHPPFDPDHRHSIPYLWGTVGIGYDRAAVESTPRSWDALWDPAYKGRISMLNDQREVFGVALRAMGHSMNTTDPDVIEEAKRKLIAQKPLVKTYTSERYDHMLAAGEVDLAHGWGGAIARAMQTRPSLAYVIPEEGATIWTDCLVVLRSSTRKSLAMQFINFLLEPEMAVRTTSRLLFASTVQGVKETMSPEIQNNPAVYPPPSAFERLEWLREVGPAMKEYDRAWTELKLH